MAAIFLAAFFIVLFLPFTLVWAVNTLTGAHTPYALKSWLAAALVIGIIRLSNLQK